MKQILDPPVFEGSEEKTLAESVLPMSGRDWPTDRDRLLAQIAELMAHMDESNAPGIDRVL